MTTPTIVKAEMHYGIPTVWVESYEATDRATGSPVVVEMFYVNGCLITAEGARVRKDGQRYSRSQCVTVPTPENVRAALDALTTTTA